MADIFSGLVFWQDFWDKKPVYIVTIRAAADFNPFKPELYEMKFDVN